MSRSFTAFKWLLTGSREELGVESDTGAFFMGRGDLLDDDRRVVRAEVVLLRAATEPSSADASRSG